jgi:hypothetical protein
VTSGAVEPLIAILKYSDFKVSDGGDYDSLRKSAAYALRAFKDSRAVDALASLIDPPKLLETPKSKSDEAPPARADLVDLIAQHKVEVEIEGGGIQAIAVKLRPTARQAQPIEVTIPVGTYFVARNSATQNMVSIEPDSALIVGNSWVAAYVGVACANRARKTPGVEDRFSVRRLPQQGELAMAVKALDRAEAPYPIVQAAVWIITDNATLADMSILLSHQEGSVNSHRVIGEDEAARAMKILADAGINIKRKAIWLHDRETLAHHFIDNSLREWLQSK